MDIQKRRAKVVALVNAGLSEREIAKQLGVSRSTVWNDKHPTPRRMQEEAAH